MALSQPLLPQSSHLGSGPLALNTVWRSPNSWPLPTVLVQVPPEGEPEAEIQGHVVYMRLDLMKHWRGSGKARLGWAGSR